MGLDMYIFQTKEGYSNMDSELAYWRKHPNLHGYIVNTFKNGVDDCEPIELSQVDVIKIYDAVSKDELPFTEGFFFGTSRPEQKTETLNKLREVLDFIKNNKKSVYYQASW